MRSLRLDLALLKSSPALALALSSLALSPGCEELAVDLSPPRLMRAPFGPGIKHEVPVRPRLRFVFNEALDPDSVQAGGVALLPWDESGDLCDGLGACSEGLCVVGRCVEDPLSSSLRSALGDGDSVAGVAVQISLESGPAGANSVVVLEPRRALAAHTTFAAFLGPSLRDRAGNPVGFPTFVEHEAGIEIELEAAEPLRVDFTTAARGSSGPEAQLVWPVAGARLVPTNLAYVESAFWNTVRPAGDARLFLERESFAGDENGERGATGDSGDPGRPGRPGDHAVGVWLEAPVPCDGWVSGSCTRWRVGETLEPAARYRLGPGEFTDDAGRPSQLPADSAWFEVGPGPDVQAPAAQLSLSLRPPCTHVGFAIDERVRATLVDGSSGVSVELDGQGWLELALRGGASPSRASLLVVDAADNRFEREVDIGATDPEIDLVLSEVLVNAVGTESAGEFVELARLPAQEPGDDEAARGYAGLWISDLSWGEVLARLEAGEEPPGDALPEFELRPAQVAVIAADSFDASAVPADAQVLRVGTSIASGGLKNEGEPLSLYDPIARQLWSSYGVTKADIDHGASAHQGRSALRRDLRACDLATSWISEPNGGATPGRLP